MKLLLVAGSLNQGGSEYQLLALSLLLTKNGFDNEVYAITNHDYFLQFVIANNIKYSCNSNKGNSLQKLKRTLIDIIRKKPDLVISFNKRPSQVAIYARILSGMKFKLVISERTAQVKPFRDFLYFTLARLADIIVTNSTSRCEQIKHLYPWLRERTVFIPNIVDLQRFQTLKNHKAESPYHQLACVGRIAREKNIHSLLHAVQLLQSKGYRMKLNLIGQANDKKYLNSLLNLIDSLHLGEIVKYLGPTNDITDVYRSTDLLCQVSYYEGFSNVIAEAVSAGIPVVASDIPENRFLITESQNGFLVSPENPDSIADGIERYLRLTYSEKIQMLNNNLLKASQLFDQKLVISSYRRIINTLMDISD